MAHICVARSGCIRCRVFAYSCSGETKNVEVQDLLRPWRGCPVTSLITTPTQPPPLYSYLQQFTYMRRSSHVKSFCLQWDQLVCSRILLTFGESWKYLFVTFTLSGLHFAFSPGCPHFHCFFSALITATAYVRQTGSSEPFVFSPLSFMSFLPPSNRLVP